MSEKIKGIYGSIDKANEVRDWLLTQGMRNEFKSWDFSCEGSIYCVHDGSLKVVSDAFKWLFDIVELPERPQFKPFDKVLVRDKILDKWKCNLYSHYDENNTFPYICISSSYRYCIPYEGNEHLVGTKDDQEGGKL